MKLLQLSNALIAAILLAATGALLAKGIASSGTVAAIGLPLINFGASFIALRKRTSRSLSIGLWLNALLLALFIAIDSLALFVFKVRVNNAAATIAFQALLIALPATANIMVFRRIRSTA
jgi:hypothetical protein